MPYYEIQVCLVLTFAFLASMHEQADEKGMFRDGLDGKLDMSHFLLDVHGFFPFLKYLEQG